MKLLISVSFLLTFALIVDVEGYTKFKPAPGTRIKSGDWKAFPLIDFLERPRQQVRSEKGFMDIIGLYSEIMGVYDAIVNPSTAELAAQIKEGFQRVEQQLATIQQSINEVINIILDQSIRTQYASAERVVTESLRCYNAYLNMTSPEGQEYWRQEFLKIGGMLRESVSFLLDGMLGRNIFAGDLLLTVVNNEQCRAGRVRDRIDTFMGLINSGIYAHAAYVRIYPLTDEINAPFRDLVSTSYDEIIDRLADQIVECEREDNVDAQMTSIMQQNSGESTERVLEIMFEFLADRYDTKSWFVIVYDALSGFQNHCVSGYFHSVFRQGNKNAAATSFPAGQEYRFEQYQWDFLNNFPCDNYNNAESAWNDVTAQLSTVGVAAVKRFSGLWGQYSDSIDVSWRNCRDLTLIAIPPVSATAGAVATKTSEP